MHRTRVAGAIVVPLVLFAACSSNDVSDMDTSTTGLASDAPSASGSASATAPATVSPSVTSPPTTSAGDGPDTLTFFRTPSGNIGCVVSKTEARCDIREHTWAAPPKPKDCELDWGNGLYVDDTGKAGVLCAGDTALDPSAGILEYEDELKLGPLTCTSQESGVTCRETKSFHGFTLSRTSYHLF